MATLGEGKIDVVVQLKREQRKKRDETLTVFQIKATIFFEIVSLPSS